MCFGLLGPFQTKIVYPQTKQEQPQDRKTIFETLSLPVAKIRSPVAIQAPTNGMAITPKKQGRPGGHGCLEEGRLGVPGQVWKSGSSGSCRLLLHFLGKIAVQEMSGKTPGSPRHPSSRHPRPKARKIRANVRVAPVRLGDGLPMGLFERFWFLFLGLCRAKMSDSLLRLGWHVCRTELPQNVSSFKTKRRKNNAKYQGRASPAFSKPCLCVSDTHHFRHFRRCRGRDERNPCFTG